MTYRRLPTAEQCAWCKCCDGVHELTGASSRTVLCDSDYERSRG